MAMLSHPVFPKGFPGKCQRAFFVSGSRAHTHTLHPREELNPPSVCPKPALALLALLLMLMKSEDQLSLANSALSWPLRPA